jgi:hypothetical protein
MKRGYWFLIIGVIFILILAIIFGLLYSSKENSTQKERVCESSRGEYELRVYDSQGRVTGLVNGEQKRDIPNSFYFSEKITPGLFGSVTPQEVIVFEPEGNYIYEIYGIKEGYYNFNPSSKISSEIIKFNAINISIFPKETHRYSFDWDALAKGESGATVQVDSDNNGKFEIEFNSDVNLTCQEFNSKFNN